MGRKSPRFTRDGPEFREAIRIAWLPVGKGIWCVAFGKAHHPAPGHLVARYRRALAKITALQARRGPSPAALSARHGRDPLHAGAKSGRCLVDSWAGFPRPSCHQSLYGHRIAAGPVQPGGTVGTLAGFAENPRFVQRVTKPG